MATTQMVKPQIQASVNPSYENSNNNHANNVAAKQNKRSPGDNSSRQTSRSKHSKQNDQQFEELSTQDPPPESPEQQQQSQTVLDSQQMDPLHPVQFQQLANHHLLNFMNGKPSEGDFSTTNQFDDESSDFIAQFFSDNKDHSA